MYTLGIDIGSTTSKCAVLKDGTELVGKSLQRGGLGTDGPAEALADFDRCSHSSDTIISKKEVK